jgi:hypothetical protein
MLKQFDVSCIFLNLEGEAECLYAANFIISSECLVLIKAPRHLG